MSASPNPYIKSNEFLLPGLVLFLGAVLRFYHLASWSLSDEELNVIAGAQSIHTPIAFQQLSSEGIRKFLFLWMNIFGQSPFAVRLPFALLGIGSVYLIYKTSERWFGTVNAMFAALAAGLSGFLILNAQMISLYSPGVFFSLLTIWLWTKIVFSLPETRVPRKVYIQFAVSFALCGTIHFLSLLLMLVVFIYGLFFCGRERKRSYIIAGIGAILLMIPSLLEFFNQVTRLRIPVAAAAEENIFLRSFYLGFNDSDFLVWPILAILAGSFIFYYRKWNFTHFHLLSLLLFGFPFLASLFLPMENDSFQKNAVFAFSFPFLIMFLFSFIRSYPEIKIVATLLLLAVSGTWSLFGDSRFYSTQHFGTFKDLAETTKMWNEKYGKKNISKSANVAQPFYLDYYFNRLNEKDTFSIYKIRSTETLGDLKDILDSVKTDYFLYAWSSAGNLPETKYLIQNYYPSLVESRNYLNSGIYLFKRDNSMLSSQPYFSEKHTFEETGRWENDSIYRSTENPVSGKYSVKLDSHAEFSPTFNRKMNTMRPPGDSATLIARVWAYLPDSASDCELVISFESLKNVYDWHSQKLNNFLREGKKWTQIIAATRIPVLPSSEDIVKVYVWNPKKKNLFLDNFSIEVVNE